MTNYEKIKNMSVEELAALFDRITEECAMPLNSKYRCKSCPVYLDTGMKYCDETIIERWLLYEREENEKGRHY